MIIRVPLHYTNPNQSGRIIFAENTQLHETLETGKQHGWTVHLDTHSLNVLHFMRKCGDDNVVVSCFFGYGPDDPLFHASVWTDAHSYGDGQIWLPVVLFEVKTYALLMYLLKSDDPREEKENVR